MTWEPVIGLEIHVQLATRSKLFSGAATAYGAPPNAQACAVDLGFPGVLPVINEAAVRMAIRFGLAIGATISRNSAFARKNYFYPDLPKGYQISQYERPIVSGGSVDISVAGGASKTVRITRAHLEEDAGKSLHEQFDEFTGIDLNRAGTPLIEIVSEPELSTAAEASAYMKKIHALVRYLEISDANMQEGSFRCDANVSIRRRGETVLGTRTEIKNLNSFRFVELAIDHEIERQADLLESGQRVIQETRLFDAQRNETRAMRGKEEANDYRYFPDPDLLPLEIDESLIAEVRESLPELPDQKRDRFQQQYGIAGEDSAHLTLSRELADYFEALVSRVGGDARVCVNWIRGELSATLNRTNTSISDSPVTPDMLAELINRIEDGTISGRIAKRVFEKMWQEQRAADAIIETEGLRQVSDTALIEAFIDEVIAENPVQVEQYRAGKEKVLGFFVGRIMQKTQGKANPGQVNKLLRNKLKGNN